MQYTIIALGVVLAVLIISLGEPGPACENTRSGAAATSRLCEHKPARGAVRAHRVMSGRQAPDPDPAQSRAKKKTSWVAIGCGKLRLWRLRWLWCAAASCG